MDGAVIRGYEDPLINCPGIVFPLSLERLSTFINKTKNDNDHKQLT